ncbi:hypothetical protein NQ315_006875 [Exocentrus adspersus]|uniref:Myrosinase 1-like n=1 Tax=Exocentrus adspersus TaxID=1586481 RepID=A0AAV8WCQ8_9CUCU|nr:hypothetical protein NQ315_006875 [Exocentrus adspersus]
MQCLSTILVLSAVFAGSSCYEVTNLTFPASFLFGTATAAYQIEGAWNESGKSVSRWDHITHTSSIVVDGSNGDVACDSYHKYKEDIEMLKQLGVDFYRFSIAWTRIIPSGFANDINQAGVDYYNNLIDGLLEAGIEPWVTMYHWDIPQVLNYIGDFSNPYTIDYVVDYADVLFSLFGDRVKTWITFNEPLSFCAHFPLSSAAFGVHLPAGISEYLCSHNIVIAHAKIYRLYQLKYKWEQNGRISIALNTEYAEPATDSPADIEASNRKLLYDLGWYAYPLVHGDYPRVMIDTIRNLSAIQGFPFSRLPMFTLNEKVIIRGAYDFFALNHYTSSLTADASSVIGSPSFLNDDLVEQFKDPAWGNSSASWLTVYPEGLRKLLVHIKETYNDPEIAITENGFADEPGVLNDVGRVSYYQSYLSEVLKAMLEDGVKVTAYTAWSLMDNFEWYNGYTVRFGLYYVDFDSPDRTRTAKESAGYYRNVIQTRCLTENCGT